MQAYLQHCALLFRAFVLMSLCLGGTAEIEGLFVHGAYEPGKCSICQASPRNPGLVVMLCIATWCCCNDCGMHKSCVCSSIMHSLCNWRDVHGLGNVYQVCVGIWIPLFLDPSDGVFGRFDLAALCGCRTLNFCLFVCYIGMDN